MNKEYIYKDGEVLIISEDNKAKKENYYDNLKKVLITENLIEEIEKKITNLSNKIEKDEKEEKKQKKLGLIYFLLYTIIPLITGIIIGKLGGIVEVLSIPLIGQIQMNVILGICAALFFAVPGSLTYCGFLLEAKHKKQEKIGKETEIEFLQKQKEIELSSLKELKRNKTNTINNTEFSFHKVDNQEHFEYLDSLLNLYFDIGYNKNKYYRYYKNGNIDEKLSKIWDKAGIELTKEYFSENKKLVKKKDN